jgi:hypothetical protein
MDDMQISSLLGRAALKVWPQLPPEAQEMLFKAATDEGVIANALATYLHDHPGRPIRQSPPLWHEASTVVRKTHITDRSHGSSAALLEVDESKAELGPFLAP